MDRSSILPRRSRQSRAYGITIRISAWSVSGFGYRRSVTALYRLLRRLDIIPPPAKKRRRKPILVLQIDVKYVPASLARRKCYQYTAVDECTRWRYAAIYDELSTWNSMRFVKELQKRFPFEISCIQTDTALSSQVERSHRSDQERFYRNRTFHSFRYLRDQFSRHLRQSNKQLLIAHGWRSASQMLLRYQEVV